MTTTSVTSRPAAGLGLVTPPAAVMTPSAWARCTDPQPMLEYVAGRVSSRKLTLWACACWRRLFASLAWSWRWRERLGRDRRAVEAAELHADGLISLDRLNEIRDGSGFEISDSDSPEKALAWAACLASGDQSGSGGRNCVRTAAVLAACVGLVGDSEPATEAEAQADLLREVVGDPFRPIKVEPAWLAWNDGTVRHLAGAAYERRLLPLGTLDEDLLGVLADALEDSGCADDAVVGHLRGPGAHVAGCTVLDALLGRS